MDKGLLSDLLIGLSFSLDLPRGEHIKKEKENLLLRALAVAKREEANGWFDAFFRMLDRYNSRGGVTILRKEYQRLFELPSPVVPPYEHLFLGAKLISVSSALLDLYRDFGFAPSSDFKDLPDHITVELEFASRLSYGVMKGEIGNEEFEFFWKNHIKRWVPDFAQAVLEESREEYYQQVTLILKELIRGKVAND